MRHFFAFILFALVGCAIIAQRDVDGTALIANYMGLHIALWVCVAGMLWSLAGAARVGLTVESN